VLTVYGAAQMHQQQAHQNRRSEKRKEPCQKVSVFSLVSCGTLVRAMVVPAATVVPAHKVGGEEEIKDCKSQAIEPLDECPSSQQPAGS